MSKQSEPVDIKTILTLIKKEVALGTIAKVTHEHRRTIEAVAIMVKLTSAAYEED